jgi:LmbE family N-acetylglucosaminyl deacetylase
MEQRRRCDLVRTTTDRDSIVGVDDPDNSSPGLAVGPLHRMPAWREVLAVVAHPDDESFGLGAILASFVAAGSQVSLLCLTHGEASTLHGVEGDLGSIRAQELSDAAAALGIARVRLAGFPDGDLSGVDLEVLVAEIADFAGGARTDGIVTFDRGGVTGHPDHRRATDATIAFASRVGIPVLGWALPHVVASKLNVEFDADFSGFIPSAIDFRVPVDRERQRTAIALHRSQAVPGQSLWRRLELTGAYEHARWQERAPAPEARDPLPTAADLVDITTTTNAAALSPR